MLVYYLPFQAKKLQRIFYLNLNSMGELFLRDKFRYVRVVC